MSYSHSTDGGAAFPLQTTIASGMGGTIDLTDRHRLQSGMSLRDYFAAKALQGMCSAPEADRSELKDHDDAARVAYNLADAMLKERAK